ncbi:CHAD domain-containing protein [Ancylobacter sp. Lp-2]|uniref:CHAD domain-containing protein n=1 Tax=Ancylobacter sp. Lp-2 TaxID=2881339 RepID=UPI001E283781|nr:CHAD domain-containing protein [Ancylobacter sp. Lp-2]MCB4771788.1 CHAD domain-containing protein [Ancylobacter sp. Lp-2]
MCTHLDEDAVPPVSHKAITTSGPLVRALRAALRAADRAIDHEDSAEGVHDLRKAFKQLRGLLRLVRGSGRADAQALRTELRTAARALAGARETVVMRETLDLLAQRGRLSPQARRAASHALTDKAAPPEDDFPPALRAGMSALVARGGHAVAGMAGQASPKVVVAAITADYERARRRGRVVDVTDDEQLHEFRKAVIAHRYQMELLTPYWPALGKRWVKELQKLRDKLGHHHDLAVLIAAVRADGPVETGWRAAVLKQARARQKKLVAGALRRQACLFAERPGAFGRRLRAYAKAAYVAG